MSLSTHRSRIYLDLEAPGAGAATPHAARYMIRGRGGEPELACAACVHETYLPYGDVLTIYAAAARVRARCQLIAVLVHSGVAEQRTRGTAVEIRAPWCRVVTAVQAASAPA